MMQYYHIVFNMMSKFKTMKVEHIKREKNKQANFLSKLAST